MKRFLRASAFLAAVLAIPWPLHAASSHLPNSSFMPDEILVGLREEPAAARAAVKRLDRFGVKSLDALTARFNVQEISRVFLLEKADGLAARYGLNRIFKLKVPAGTDLFGAIHELARDPAVEFAEVNRIYSITATPSDSAFKKQWGLHNTGQSLGRKDADIDAPEAWDITKGSSSIVIAVIDTGVDYKHPDLADGRVLKDQGWNFISDSPDPMDDQGHGTYVAGIVGAIPNNKLGIAGVCWNCKILPVKVMNADGQGSADSVAQGIRYAADHGARILSMSLGYKSDCGCSQTMARAINYAYEHGSLLIAASGNDSDKTRTSYPASSPRVLAVGATDRRDAEADFSNRDADLDIMAPGKDIFSLDLSSKSQKYRNASGTSAATPFVSGVAGLLLSQRPELQNGQVWQTLRSTTDKLAKAPGRLNAASALTQVSLLSFPAPVDTCSAEPSCTPGCAAEVTLTGALQYVKALGDLRDFRERVLRPTGLGQQWIALYERHRMEVASILARDSKLRDTALRGLESWIPIFRSMGGESKAGILLSAEDVRLAHEVLEGLMARATPELRRDLQEAQATLDEEFLLVGNDRRQLLEALAAQ